MKLIVRKDNREIVCVCADNELISFSNKTIKTPTITISSIGREDVDVVENVVLPSDYSIDLYSYESGWIKTFDLRKSQLLQKKLTEFEDFQKSFRREITELYLEEIALGTLPQEVKNLIGQLQLRKAEVIAELQGFYNTGNVERLLNYSFYTEETEQFKQALYALKQ